MGSEILWLTEPYGWKKLEETKKYEFSKNQTNLVNRPQSRHKTPPNQVLTRKVEFFSLWDRGQEIIDKDWMKTEDKREGKRNKG